MSTTPAQKRSKALFWLVFIFTALLLALPVLNVDDITLLMKNDDRMRLVQVRDLLAGQGWYDLMQYRLGFDGGTLMHWSRLVDAPIAGLIWLMSRFMQPAAAEAVMLVVWPVALAGAILAGMQAGAARLGGAMAGNFALLIGAMTVITTRRFDAGSIDHHNVQLLLVVLAIAAVMGREARVSSGVAAGLAVAFSLAVGLETLLFVAAVAMFITLKWALTGAAARPQAMGFAAAFGGGLAGLMLLLQPDFSNTVFRCDTFGADLAGIGIAGSLGLLALAGFGSRQKMPMRLAAVAGLGGGVLVFAWFYAPACLSNPLGQLYPDVANIWLGSVTEAKPLLSIIKSSNGAFAGMFVLPVLAIAMAVYLAFDRKKTAAALFLVGVLAVSFGMALYQIRGITFVLVISVFPISVFLGQLYARYRRDRSLIKGLTVIVLLLASIPDLWTYAYVTVIAATKTPEKRATAPAGKCHQAANYATLRTLPPGRVVTITNLAPIILQTTRHSVMTSNFHRNQDGIQAGIDLARAPIADVPDMLGRLGVDYLVVCLGETLKVSFIGDNPDGIWARLATQDPPDFVTPIAASAESDILIFKVNLKKEP